MAAGTNSTGDLTDAVIDLLRALQRHRTYQPARLSPFTERAYAQAEARLRALEEQAS